MTVQHALGSTTIERAPERIVALGQIDADVALIYAFGNTEEQAVAQNAALGSLSAVRDGRAYWLPDLSLSAPSVLSIPYGVDAMLPFLEEATA